MECTARRASDLEAPVCPGHTPQKPWWEDVSQVRCSFVHTFSKRLCPRFCRAWQVSVAIGSLKLRHASALPQQFCSVHSMDCFLNERLAPEERDEYCITCGAMQRKGRKRLRHHLTSAMPGCSGASSSTHSPPDRCACSTYPHGSAERVFSKRRSYSSGAKIGRAGRLS